MRVANYHHEEKGLSWDLNYQRQSLQPYPLATRVEERPPL
jgi:hypothetical protein